MQQFFNFPVPKKFHPESFKCSFVHAFTTVANSCLLLIKSKMETFSHIHKYIYTYIYMYIYDVNLILWSNFTKSGRIRLKKLPARRVGNVVSRSLGFWCTSLARVKFRYAKLRFYSMYAELSSFLMTWCCLFLILECFFVDLWLGRPINCQKKGATWFKSMSKMFLRKSLGNCCAFYCAK